MKFGASIRAEKRFRLYGLCAIIASLLFLSLLFLSIIGNGYTAFLQTFMKLDIHLDAEVLDKDNLSRANYPILVKKSIRSIFPDVKGRRDKRMLDGLVSTGAAFQIREMVMNNPDLIGTTQSVWVPADDDLDMLMKGHIDRNDFLFTGRQVGLEESDEFPCWQIVVFVIFGHVDLRHFLAGNVASVTQDELAAQSIGVDTDSEVAVLETGIGQAVPKGEQWLDIELVEMSVTHQQVFQITHNLFHAGKGFRRLVRRTV